MTKALAAVPRAETFRLYMNRSARHLRHYFRYPDAQTFNAGVLLFDLDKWRSDVSTESLERWIELFSGYDFDQLALNLEFQGSFDVLSWEWNVLGLGWFPSNIPQSCVDRARILHWNGPFKPWSPHSNWSLRRNLSGHNSSLLCAYA